MFNNIGKSAGIALQNIKANPLHTLLSTLGIIIGIASLVAILAVGDGLEKFGREQIGSTTSLEFMTINSQQFETVDGIRVPLEERTALTYDDFRAIQQVTKERGLLDIYNNRTGIVELEGDTVRTSAFLNGRSENFIDLNEFELTGRFFTGEEVQSEAKLAVVSKPLATKFGFGNDLVGKSIVIEDNTYLVIGILDAEALGERVEVYYPITIFKFVDGRVSYPDMLFRADLVEDLPAVQEDVEAVLAGKYEDWEKKFRIGTNEGRVAQFQQSILIFKLVMGMITGISVLVGGIGVMNVLLISVTERTREIGIRKATGAKRSDILMQFLSESVTVSLAGCIAGLILGMSAVFAFVPVVKAFTEVDFPVAFTWTTVSIILTIGFFVGLVFGTYPAWRASKLTPVDAIRHE